MTEFWQGANDCFGDRRYACLCGLSSWTILFGRENLATMKNILVISFAVSILLLWFWGVGYVDCVDNLGRAQVFFPFW